jgi:hypothetical protein
MIFNTPENTGVVASSGMGSTSVARIATTSHMFSILSSRLYSDKVAAVLREIGCNALDAHTAAGTPELPFEVKLPNQLDPTFYIKDWGPGLTEEGVRDLYMTYGESTKQNSNKFVGAMGLGSKSPFAYTHTFTIVAAKEGVKRFFTAYLNEDRVPVVTKTLECESEPDWPNGLMVTFPVENSDMREFHDKARLIYSWFTVAPRVLGLPEEDKPKFPEFEMVKPGRYGFKPKNHVYARSPAVVMGNIRYPLDMSKVYERYPDVRDVFMTIANQGVHLFVEIGEVMFTPNREALEYDKGTLESLKNRFIEVIRDIGSTLAQRLAEKEDTTVAYMRKLEALRSEYESTGLLSRRTLPQMLKVCGMSTEDIEGMPTLSEPLIIKASEGVSSKWVTETKGDTAPYLELLLVRRETTRNNETRVRTSVVSRGQFYASRRADTNSSPVAFSANANVVVFHLEGKKEGKSKVQALVASKDIDFALLVIPTGGATEEQARELAEFIAGPEALDGYPVMSTKALDLPKERVKQLLNRRTTRLTQDERLQRIRTFVVTAKDRYPTETTLYGAIGDGVKYYAVTGDMRGSYNTHRQLTGDDGLAVGFTEDTLRELLSDGQMTALMAALGHAPDATKVALFSPSSLKRVNTKDAGLVNIVDLLKGWFRDEAMLKTLGGYVDDTEVLDSAYREVCSYYSPLARLTSLREQDSVFWKAIAARYSGSDLMAALDTYSSYKAERESDDEPTSNPVCDAMRSLRGTHFAGSKVNALLEGVPSERATLLRTTHKRLSAAMATLNWDHLCSQALNGDVHVAMAFFDLAMMLGGIMPVRSIKESAFA